MLIRKGQADLLSEIMTSKPASMMRTWLLGALLAASPSFANSSATDELHQLIRNSPELKKSFGASTVYAVSSQRAEASAAVGNSRHAVVLYSASLKSGIGESFCRVALGGPERTAWLSQLSTVLNSDPGVAEVLASEYSVKTTMRRAEYHSIKSPDGWLSGVCVVKQADIKATYPELPDQTVVRAATYQLGKQLFTAGKTDKALERFQPLRLDSTIYPNALLYIIAILDLDESRHPIADALRDKHLDISKASDTDALKAYAMSSASRGLSNTAEAAGLRCEELKIECYRAPIKQQD